jgi:hypothetical protein
MTDGQAPSRSRAPVLATARKAGALPTWSVRPAIYCGRVMALPTSYMMGTAKLGNILTAIQSAQAPPKFNRTFLENLGFTSSGDRLVINVLKAIGLLASDGTPTDRYFRFLDQTQAGQVLAEGIREAYADLFQLNRDAQTLPKAELKGKIKTLTQGKVSDNVVEKMAITFQGLVKHADFKTPVLSGRGEPTDESADSLQSARDDEEDNYYLRETHLSPMALDPSCLLPVSFTP